MELGPESVTITYHILWGIFWVGLAGFARRISAEGSANWHEIWEPDPPSLEVNQSPAERVLGGIMGLLTSIFFQILFVLFALLAIDQFFFQGELYVRIWDAIHDLLKTLINS